MKKSICAKCKNFCNYYVYSKMFGFSKINCGYCKKKLIKQKDCNSFEERVENFEKEVDIINYLHIYDRQIIQLSAQMGKLMNSIFSLKYEIEKHFEQE